MKITPEDVSRVAELAHLELNETEMEPLLQHLNSILTYADKLNELDTSNVEPMAQVLPPGAATAGHLPSTPLREDTVVPSHVVDEVLPQAPDGDAIYFRVPKVIDR
jgi:aspartyl-tRNA(Asn)/glutamyl-tRNA(Gln) amidotransferase subunit C